MTSRSVNTKQLAVPFVASILIVVTLFGGIFPGIMAINNGRKKLLDLKTVAGSLSYKAAALENLDQTSLSQKVDLSVSALPLTIPYQTSIQMLSTLLTNSGLEINDLQVAKPAGSAGSVLNIEMSLKGDFEKINELLTNFGRSIPLVAVKTVELSRSRQSGGEDKEIFLADVKLFLFYDKPPKTIGKPSELLPSISAEFEKALRTLQSFTVYKYSPGDISTSNQAPAERLFSP